MVFGVAAVGTAFAVAAVDKAFAFVELFLGMP